MKNKSVWFILATVLLLSCGEDTFTPKPRGYFQVSLPNHEYQQFQDPTFPYSFEYPTYGQISREKYFFDKEAPNPYWINVVIPELSGTIYLSYSEIKSDSDLEKLLNDAHFLSFYHSRKADFIDDAVFQNHEGVNGVFYKVGGDAASAYQFYATDSVQHFLRGALYIDAIPNADSLKPMYDFLKKDLEHLMQTLRWH